MFGLSDQAIVLCCVALAVCGPWAQAGSVGGTSTAAEVPAAHFEPQVAVMCEPRATYHNQYMTEAGHWVSDPETKAICPRDKMAVLEYCKKVYPKRDITNIVEASHYLKVPNWCKVGQRKCKISRWVKPYRCLEGPFQSDALLVPETCLFDHIHNQTKCWEFALWNQTAALACQSRDMTLRSFAMLLPCGISLFNGVEFVCCPKHAKDNMKPKKPIDITLGAEQDSQMAEVLSSDKVGLEGTASTSSDEDDGEDSDEDADDLSNRDDENDDDDYGDDQDDEGDGAGEDSDDMQGFGVASSTPAAAVPTPAPTSASPLANSQTPVQPTGQQVPTPDPYFTHFDPRGEHQAYKEAQQRLEEMHREKVTKDWSDLEERYQDMRQNDPGAADDFKKKMTQRFQKTVQALEEEGDAEKHQLTAMHQQRVMAHINERKKEAMACYTDALSENPPNTHRVQKCLQKLLRSLHKDRHHSIAHYRHLLVSSPDQADRERGLTLEHLVDIDKMVNQSLQMLDHYPELAAKIRVLMEDYLTALRSKDETPGSLLSMSRDAEAAILDKFRAEVQARQEEKDRQKMMERQRKEQRKAERMHEKEAQRRAESQKMDTHYDSDIIEEERALPSSLPSAEAPAMLHSQHDPVPKPAHAQAHDISHGEPTFSVRREVYHRERRSVYFTLIFAGVAIMAAGLVGVAVLRRRNARSPQNQGFIEVDQAATPEERHVANMQINGYENPTYKYFEAKE
ncbi:amyloid-beta-like protein isoform X2 [Neocloeon triangulifer]|uniref:amyloid-beta-like protein isoform X2 n=1 Tax=Neocloeon triangulifer TaxID=2078957 RepID=UPI00286F1CCC|nr:amyloid-beta-like protein isoform X2 [Neocloeon triangulifer]